MKILTDTERFNLLRRHYGSFLKAARAFGLTYNTMAQRVTSRDDKDIEKVIRDISTKKQGAA